MICHWNLGNHADHDHLCAWSVMHGGLISIGFFEMQVGICLIRTKFHVSYTSHTWHRAQGCKQKTQWDPKVHLAHFIWSSSKKLCQWRQLRPEFPCAHVMCWNCFKYCKGCATALKISLGTVAKAVLQLVVESLRVLLGNCWVFGVYAHHFLQQRVVHLRNAIPKKKSMPRTRAHSIETRAAGIEHNFKKSCLWAILAEVLCARKYLMPDSYISFACCWDLAASMHKHPHTHTRVLVEKDHPLNKFCFIITSI